LLLRLASFRRWIDFRMHNRWTWSETIFFMLCVISTWFWISTKQELGRRKLLDCTNLNCVEIYVGILEEEESRILILYNSLVVVLYVISTWFWIGTKQELGRRKSLSCTNLNCVVICVRRRNLESNKSNLI
jgi:hypothetical protein